MKPDARGMGVVGSGGDVQCDAERSDNETCFSPPHLFHPNISMLSVPSAVPTVLHVHFLGLTGFAAHPLFSGLSL